MRKQHAHTGTGSSVHDGVLEERHCLLFLYCSLCLLGGSMDGGSRGEAGRIPTTTPSGCEQAHAKLQLRDPNCQGHLHGVGQLSRR
jgi:hypothetical protein